MTCNLGALRQRRHQFLWNLQCFKNFLRPFSSGNIQKVRSAGIAHFGVEFSGQAITHIVFRQQNMLCLLPDFRLILLYPQDFTGGEARECGIGGNRNQALTADAGCDFIALILSPSVAPENGGTQNLAIFIQQYKAMHLAADAKRGNVLCGNAALFNDLRNRLGTCMPPGFRLLLGPAVFRLNQWILSQRRGNHISLFIKENRLCSRGTQIYT